MNKREQLYQPARELRVQNSPDGKQRVISGYAIRYNEKSSNMGYGFVEIVAPGAVTASLKNSPDVLCLRDHDQTILLGRTTSGTLTLTEDADGLRFSCTLPPTTQAADLAASIDRKDLDGVSFGFVTVEDKWTSDSEGNVVRTLLQVDLFEISPCSFPAYPSTSVRSCPQSLRPLLKRSAEDEDEEEDDCDCERDADGNLLDPDCTCDEEDEDSEEDRSARPLNWSERTLLRLEVARRK